MTITMMEREFEKGTRCVSIATESCLSSFLQAPRWRSYFGRVMYFTMIPVPQYTPIKNVKYVAPTYGMTILSKHWESIDTIVIRDLDEICPEYLILLHTLSYWKHHRVLVISPTPPPLSFLSFFFPDMVEVERELVSPGHYIHYLMEETYGAPVTFHLQRHKFEEWFLSNGYGYQRIVVYAATRHQCEIIRLYFEVAHPSFHTLVISRSSDVSVTPTVFITTGVGDEVPAFFTPDLVVEFGRFQKKCRSYYGNVVDCPKNTMRRRQRRVGFGGVVLRAMTPEEYEDRPEFFPTAIPTEWRPWSSLFLASLSLPSCDILGNCDTQTWNIKVEGSTKKRLKTLLQHPFSIRTHLMLERCGKLSVLNDIQRMWIVLAITLINWFDHYHRFLISKRSFHELQCIYGNDDELFIHMRIAILLLSKSPLIHMDFTNVHSVNQKFCQHFHQALRLVYRVGEYPPLPSVMTAEDKDAVRYFLMTDPRVERYYPTNENVYSYWNSISYLSAYTFRNHHCVLLLCTTTNLDETRATLWTFMPSSVIEFKNTLAPGLLDMHEKNRQKETQKDLFRDRVIRYFKEVLVHAAW